MDTDKKVKIIIDILPLIPLVARGIAEAAETYNRMVNALKDDTISEEEWQEAISKRDEVLGRVIAKTES